MDFVKLRFDLLSASSRCMNHFVWTENLQTPKCLVANTKSMKSTKHIHTRTWTIAVKLEILFYTKSIEISTIDQKKENV